jgi:hypothetical protein
MHSAPPLHRLHEAPGFQDNAYIIDGQKIDSMLAKIAQKVPIDGFFISVACRQEQA